MNEDNVALVIVAESHCAAAPERAVFAGGRMWIVTADTALVVVAALIGLAVVMRLRHRSARPSNARSSAGHGCLPAGIGRVGGVFVIGVVLLVLLWRSCSTESEPFVVRVVSATDSEICLEHVGDGPDYVDGCHSRSFIDDLPTSIAVGQCMELRERDPFVRYLNSKTCPGGG